MASSSMTFRIFGHDVSASKTFKDVGKTAAGVASGMGVAFAGAKLADFAKQSLDAFNNLGGETLKLQRYMGGSAEDASRLAHAFTMTGVPMEQATKGLGILSKHFAANDAAAKSLGISFRDSAGHVKPMGELLPQIAERFAKMPAGAERSALAMQLFGKGGMAMLPFLAKGKDGVAALMAESDKFGTTLSGKDLEAVKKNTAAKRQFGEAVKGLQIALGRYLFPVLSQIVAFMTEKVVPVVKTVVEWFAKNKDILGPLAAIILTVVAAFKVWTVVMGIFNAVAAMNPVGLVVMAIVALVAILVLAYKKVGWFRTAVQWAWKHIQAAVHAFVQWFKQTAWPFIKKIIGFIVEYYKFLWRIVSAVFKWIWNTIGGFVRWFMAHVWPTIRRIIGFIVEYYKMMWRVVSSVFKWIWGVISGFVGWFARNVWPAISRTIKLIRDAFMGIWNTASAVFGWVWDRVLWFKDKLAAAVDGIKGFFTGIWDGLKNGFQSAIDWIKSIWNRFLGGKGFHIPGTSIDFKIPMLAAGGIVTRPTLAVVGENGPEAVIPLRGRNAGLGGGTTEIHIHLSGTYAGSKEQLARTVADALVDARNRGLNLGVA